ncbi:MAG: HAD hydrolase-like protein, partial [Pseudomonadota bacterium]
MSGRHWARRRAPKHAPDPEASSKSAFILFDVDGTLLDGAHAIAGTMVDAFLAAGEPPPQLREVRELIGLSLPEMVDVLTAGRPRDLGDKIRAGYLVRYFDAIERQFEPPVFPGAETAILRLRRAGIPLGLVTGKAARSVRQMLDAMDWHQHFRTVQCADRNPSKPDPTMVAKALL